MSVQERAREEMRQKSATFDPNDYHYDDPEANPPDLDRFYSSLESYTKMVTGGYTKLFMLDARGGLGKTYNVKRICKEELDDPSKFQHMAGFTTPLELYKTLWKAQHEDTVHSAVLRRREWYHKGHQSGGHAQGCDRHRG